MKIILASLLLVLIGMQTFSVDGSLAPGLSVKNAMIYLAGLVVVGRYVIAGNFRIDLPALHLAFVFLIVYAVLTWLMLAFVVRDPNYSALGSAMRLKRDVLDHFIVFVLFFYGLRSLSDAMSAGQALFVGVVLANVVTVLDASGVLGWEIVPIRTEDEREFGRVQGAFGEANEHGAIVAMVLPALVAKALASSGIRRAFWTLGVGFAIAAIFMTASRGAMAGLMFATLVGGFVFREYLSLGRVLVFGIVASLFVAVVVVALSDSYSALLQERLIGLTFSGNAADASSGRTEIWEALIERMMESPWSLVTGFGWDAYAYMGFDYAPHNTYLGTWFNLGLPGLVAFFLVLGCVLAAVRSGVQACSEEHRGLFIGMWVGFVAVCGSVFFVEMHRGWIFFWAYAGIVARGALWSSTFANVAGAERSAGDRDGTAGGAVRPVGIALQPGKLRARLGGAAAPRPKAAR
jgi:O-antigen ligase